MPRAGLTPDRVVQEAADVADEVGWERLTLAAVAERLGVKLPSLYKHIDSLDALRQGVAAAATRELAAAVTAAAVGVSGPDALRRLGHAYRGYARAHPGRYAATVRPPTEPGRHREATEAVLSVVLAVLAGYGIEGDDGIDAARSLRAAMHGFVALEEAGGFGLPRDVERSFSALLDGMHDMLRGWETRADAAGDGPGHRIGSRAG